MKPQAESPIDGRGAAIKESLRDLGGISSRSTCG